MASDVGMQALAARLNNVAEITTGDMSTMANASARKAKMTAKQIASSVTGGDGRLSHHRNGRLNSAYDIDNGGRRITVKLTPYSPWALTEKGAKPHMIPRAVSRERARFLKGASYEHPVRGPIMHRGAPGIRKQSITRTFRQLRDQMSEDYHTAYVAELGKAMG